MNVETNGSRIRWRAKDIYKSIGVGYDKYAPGKASVYKDDGNNELVFLINPLKKQE